MVRVAFSLVCMKMRTCLIPRLLSKARGDEALSVLARFHGSGEVTPLVKLEYSQIEASATTLPKGIRDRWNFSTLLRTKGDRHRFLLCIFAS
jgi:hypothetical protein